MNDQTPKKSIQEAVLEKIKKGEAKMRPKLYFVLGIISWVVGVVIVFSAGAYLVSFIIFILRDSGLWFTPAFGFRGMRILFGNFPWLLISLVLIFIALLEILVERYSIAYKKPLIYSAFFIIALVIVAGFIVQKTSFHRGILEKVQEGRLPMARPLYNRYGAQRFEEITPGIVSDVTEDGFNIEIRDGAIIKVKTSGATNFPRGRDIEKGDYILVIGEIENGTIKAEGIIEVDRMLMPPRQNRFPPILIPSDER